MAETYPHGQRAARGAAFRQRATQKPSRTGFTASCPFGTGGLRGVLGAGTNRMNVYSVGKATFGLAAYLLKQAGEKKSVAIAYDSRIKSREFAFTIAEIFSSKGIEAYIFDELTPTPVLSYAVRKLKPRRESSSPQAITPRNTTAIKYITRKAARLPTKQRQTLPPKSRASGILRPTKRTKALSMS